MKRRKPLPLEQLRPLLRALRSRSPAFRNTLPLAVGISAAVLNLAPDLGVSRVTLRRVLMFWTARPAYLKALATPGAVRHSLDGTPGDPVSADHRDHAQQALQRLQFRKAAPVPAPAPAPAPVPMATVAGTARPILRLKKRAS